MGLSQLGSQHGTGLGSTSSRPRRKPRRAHPWLQVILLISWMITVFLINQWFFQLALLGFILLFAKRVRLGGRDVVFLLRLSIPLIATYVVIQSVAIKTGDPLLWHTGRIPWIGVLGFSRQSLAMSAMRGLRLWNLLLAMFVLGRTMRQDDVVILLGQRFTRSALTLSMVMNFIPHLLEERQRIVEVTRARGMHSTGTSTRTRIGASAVIYQTLLANALDRSWTLAESMYSRGYGAPRRTIYDPPRWRWADAVPALIMLFVAAVVVAIRVLSTSEMLAMTTTGAAIVMEAGAVLWLGGRLRA